MKETLHPKQRRCAGRPVAGRLLYLGMFSFLVACSGEDLRGPLPSDTLGRGDLPDASPRHLPGEGVGETPDFDLTTRQPPSTRSDQISDALDELRGVLMGMDASVPGSGFDPGGSPDAGGDAGDAAPSLIVDAGPNPDPDPLVVSEDAGSDPSPVEPFDAGVEALDTGGADPGTLDDAG